MTLGILHRNDVTARGRGSGDAWDVSVKERLGESPDTKRLDPMSQEGKPDIPEGRIGLQHEAGGRRGKSSRYSRDGSERHVTALKWKNIIQEILLKVALYNKWLDESISRSRCIVDDVVDMVLPS